MSKKTPLTYIGELSSNDFWISCIILKSCEVQKSPGRKSDYQTVKNSFSIKYSNIDVNIIFSNILASIVSRPISSFLRTGTIFSFLHSPGKTPSFKAASNIIFKVNTNHSPHIFVIFIEILSNRMRFIWM